MRPSKMRSIIDHLENAAVCRDGMSPESYAELENSESVEDLRTILLEVFEPSDDDE